MVKHLFLCGLIPNSLDTLAIVVLTNTQPVAQNWAGKGSDPSHQINFESVFQVKISLWTVIILKDLKEKS